MVVAAIVTMSLVLVVIYCVWALDRGFELTDESYYLLLAIHPGASSFYVSGQHWVLSWLWQIAGSLVTFRAVGLLVLVGSAGVLGAGISVASARLKMIDAGREAAITIVAACMIGALLYATTINLSPSYNLLAAAGAYTASGLILLTPELPAQSIRRYGLLVCTGAALAIEMLCKASAGVSSLLVVAFWIILYGEGVVRRVLDLTIVVVGAIGMLTLVLLTHTSFPEALSALDEGFALFSMVQVEPVGARLLRYAVEYASFLAHALLIFCLPLVALAASRYTRTRLLVGLALAGFALLIVFGGLEGGRFRIAILGGFWAGGTGHFESQVMLAFALTAAALIVGFRQWSASLKRVGLILGLFVLPYSVAVGSGNSIVTQIVDSIAPWSGLVAMLAFAQNAHAVGSLLAMAISALMSSQIISSGWAPYHMVTPLAHQNAEVDIPSLGRVRVDEGTKAFVMDIAAAAQTCSLAVNVQMLGLYNVPGVALALGAIPPHSPWLNDKGQADFVLNRSDAESIQRVVLALALSADGTLPAMPEKIIDFPERYRFCGQGVYPYNNQTIQIWTPEGP